MAKRGNPKLVKGVSGNPLGINAGRKPDIPGMKELFKANGLKAAQTICDLAENSEDERIRLAASKEVVERLLGKSEQPIVGEEGKPLLIQLLKSYVTNAIDIDNKADAAD